MNYPNPFDVFTLVTEPYWSATPTSAPVSSPTDDDRRDDNRRSLEDINFASSYKTEMGQRRLIGVECYHVHAMKSVCAFAVFMFLTYLFMIGLLLRFKDEILGSAPLNEGYLGVPNVSTLLGQPDPEFGETPSQPDGYVICLSYLNFISPEILVSSQQRDVFRVLFFFDRPPAVAFDSADL